MYISEHFKSIIYSFLDQCQKEIDFLKKQKISSESIKLISSIMSILRVLSIERE